MTRLSWGLGILTIALGVVGYFLEARIPLVGCLLCAGLTLLTLCLRGVITGKSRSRYGPLDARDNPSTFFFVTITQLALAAFLIVYALLVMLGVVEADIVADAKNMVSSWMRNMRR